MRYRIVLHGNVPIARNPGFAVGINQIMPGLQLFYRAKDRVGSWNIFIAEIFAEGSGIQVALNSGVLQERFNLGCEDQFSSRKAIVQWLFAHSIACEKQGSFFAVPQGEGKHAVELVQAFRSVFFVQVQDHFAVRMGSETMTFILKLLSELSVIVNLAVKREPHGLVFVGHRLLACRGEIDNAQPLMPESDACGVGVLGYLALVVGPAVGESAPHAMHYFRIDFFSLSDVSVNATHRVLEKLSSLRCQMICDDV